MKLSMRLSSSSIGGKEREYNFYTENELVRATLIEPDDDRPLDGVMHWRLEIFEWRDPDAGGEGHLLYAIRYVQENREDSWNNVIDRARALAVELIEECDKTEDDDDDDDFGITKGESE